MGPPGVKEPPACACVGGCRRRRNDRATDYTLTVKSSQRLVKHALAGTRRARLNQLCGEGHAYLTLKLGCENLSHLDQVDKVVIVAVRGSHLKGALCTPHVPV